VLRLVKSKRAFTDEHFELLIAAKTPKMAKLQQFKKKGTNLTYLGNG